MQCHLSLYLINFKSQSRFFYLALLKLIIIIGALSDYILKVMKSLYNVLKANNHWFATYHNYHINNLAITESTYNRYLLYKYDLFSIVDL